MPVNFTRSPHIRPVCLAGSEEVDFDDELATVTGWGHQKIRYLSQTQQGVVKGIRSKNAIKKNCRSLMLGKNSGLQLIS